MSKVVWLPRRWRTWASHASTRREQPEVGEEKKTSFGRSVGRSGGGAISTGWALTTPFPASWDGEGRSPARPPPARLRRRGTCGTPRPPAHRSSYGRASRVVAFLE